MPILNYAGTSNHIHLLVVGGDDRDVIPNSIKLIAGRTGQEYNQRKNRKGAFWEDRYHATAVENGEHLYSVFCVPIFRRLKQKGYLDVIRKALPESDAIGEIFATVGAYVDEKLH